MVYNIFVLPGIIAVVSAARNLRKDSVPQYAARKIWSPVTVHDKLHWEPLQTRMPSADKQVTSVDWAPPLRKNLATVPSYLIIFSGGDMPPLLPSEELTTLTALYHSLGGPEWHM